MNLKNQIYSLLLTSVMAVPAMANSRVEVPIKDVSGNWAVYSAQILMTCATKEEGAIKAMDNNKTYTRYNSTVKVFLRDVRNGSQMNIDIPAVVNMYAQNMSRFQVCANEDMTKAFYMDGFAISGTKLSSIYGLYTAKGGGFSSTSAGANTATNEKGISILGLDSYNTNHEGLYYSDTNDTSVELFVARPSDGEVITVTGVDADAIKMQNRQMSLDVLLDMDLATTAAKSEEK